MKMSSKARYGLYIAVELAKQYNGSDVVNVTALSQTTGVTEKYLEKIVALMKRARIVVASRGVNGGYKLADSPDNISVGQVLRAVEDNLEIVDCLHGECANRRECVARNLWSKLYDNINGYLDTISLRQLAEDKI